MREYIAAIDQGTTGTRCFLFDRQGRPVSSAYREHRQIFPRPGWVEHDASEILARTSQVVDEARHAAPPGQVLAVGVANQRETVVAWDRRDGRPLFNAIVWQDTRTADLCGRWIEQGWEEDVRSRTGLPISTYFSASKIHWLFENVAGLRELSAAGHARIGTIDAWIVWNLTGGPQGGALVTDPTNASRTLLCNLAGLCWDPVLLDRFGVPSGVLPDIGPSVAREPYGRTVSGGPFGAGIPVCGDLGDQQAALFGQACFEAGSAKNTYGTGSFLLQHAGAARPVSESGLLATAAGAVDARPAYALEGAVAVTGSAVQWLRDNLGLIASAAETEAVAGAVPDSGGVYFVPAFSGLFAPHWDMRARGAIVGLTRYATRAHLVRATLEAICFQTREVADAMAIDCRRPLEALKVDGGASGNDLLMQLQADILGVPVLRPVVRETTALGAAYAAGLGAGVFDSTRQLQGLWQMDRRFEPSWDEPRRQEALRGWKRAVARARDWLEE
ncbi:MAG TPA: glycerol kinase GlpK [Thermoanaerobaculia bacterium]|nr:glycerol kinase GlpK [Thermoanaerobaculia bacterium]